ncbi:KdsC family phosphatase [Polycyclovorans algicola]|uniref:KdsC family phosphatase n=1 Tax=Polycyclovorans algicola TaxID=616992 RepID=UPI0004A6C812|nr:HAD hydrolase family protein [Polycyclovorans algicola]
MTSVKTSPDLMTRAAKIKCLFLDIDGVLTDGNLYIGPNFEETKSNYVRDGYGIRLWLKAGYQIAVISGRPSESMRTRLQFLGVQNIVLDREDKLPAYRDIRDRLGLSDVECAHVGDDLPDVALFEHVGLACAPADAHDAARKAAHFVSTHDGGRGAVRDVIDLLLAAKATP